MPYKISIPITDGECAVSYTVEIKKQTDTVYTSYGEQIAVPIVISGLEDAVDYDIRITRRCCNGIYAQPITVQVTGMVAKPTLVWAEDQGAGDIYLEWSLVDGADNYVVDRDTDPAFPSPTNIFSANGQSVFDYSVPSGTYFYRIYAEQTGKVDSDHIIVQIIVT